MLKSNFQNEPSSSTFLIADYIQFPDGHTGIVIRKFNISKAGEPETPADMGVILSDNPAYELAKWLNQAGYRLEDVVVEGPAW